MRDVTCVLPSEAVVYMSQVLKANSLNNKIFVITNFRLRHFYFFSTYLLRTFYNWLKLFLCCGFFCFTPSFLAQGKNCVTPSFVRVFKVLFFTTVFLGVFNVFFFIKHFSIF